MCFFAVSSTTKPVFSWFRDELPIESSGRYAISQETETLCKLCIRQVEFVDQAEWKCVAKNDIGSCITSCFLRLEVPRHYKKPRFLECLSAAITSEGAVSLECKVIGVPQPTLKYDSFPYHSRFLGRIDIMFCILTDGTKTVSS